MRTCIGCRRRTAKSNLVRIVRGPDGEVQLDPTQRAPGRGAYVCANIGCLEQAVRRRRVDRALRLPAGAGRLDVTMEEFTTWQR